MRNINYVGKWNPTEETLFEAFLQDVCAALEMEIPKGCQPDDVISIYKDGEDIRISEEVTISESDFALIFFQATTSKWKPGWELSPLIEWTEEDDRERYESRKSELRTEILCERNLKWIEKVITPRTHGEAWSNVSQSQAEEVAAAAKSLFSLLPGWEEVERAKKDARYETKLSYPFSSTEEGEEIREARNNAERICFQILSNNLRYYGVDGDVSLIVEGAGVLFVHDKGWAHVLVHPLTNKVSIWCEKPDRAEFSGRKIWDQKVLNL